MRTNHQIKVEQQSEDEDKFVFDVSVEGDRSSSHAVTVDKDYYKKLTDGEEPAGNLVKRSFKFLLQREPQSAILSEFNLSLIQEYFSEYESKLKN
ncbi:MAG: hypothetical protein BRC22_01490 [Parcubacteria group bacterium QH_9_35_7]|nr:MAG: hypothetical protein BRC22_01490 [Parcubacteria group bacterium QH_9_35_7]